MKKVLSLCIIGFLILISLYIFLINFNNKENINISTHRLQWWHTELGLDKYKIKYKSQKVKIGIIDTGIDGEHQDLMGRISSNLVVNEVIDQKNFDYEHGTMVAGIIAAIPQSNIGVMGVNPYVEIVSIDISNNEKTCSVVGLIEAIDYAINNNVDIINFSLGISQNTEELYNKVKEAYSKGIILIAATDNDEKGLFPADYEEVISVGGYTREGEYMQNNNNIDIYLPGENIVTTYSSQSNQKEYISCDGSSLSCAIFSGIVSLLLQDEYIQNSDEFYSFFRGYGKVNSLDEIIEKLNSSYK